MAEGFLEEFDGRRRIEIADMLRDKCFAAARDRHRCLELGAEGDDARNLTRQTDRRRCKAARAAQEGERSGDDANHAVVGARHDRAIMIDHRVGDAGKSAPRIGSVDHDRFAGNVSRRRDQCEIAGGGKPVEAGGTPQQFPDHQPVQWCVRQEQSDGRQSVGDALCKPCFATRRHDDDRTLTTREQPRRDVVDRRETTSSREVSRHDCKRFAVAALAQTQPFYGVFAVRVADEVEAAEALERNDLAGADAGADLIERGVDLRAAGRAACRLRVEAPVGGIGVFCRAGFAQGKVRQRCRGAVVWQPPRHGEARPALRASDERVEVAAVGRIEQLGEAVLANRRIGRDRGPRRAVLLAVANDKIALARNEWTKFRFDVVDPGERRRQRDEVLFEGVNPALHLDQNAILVVQGKAGEIVAHRQPPDMRTEADPLDETADAQTQATRGNGSSAMTDVEVHVLVHARSPALIRGEAERPRGLEPVDPAIHAFSALRGELQHADRWIDPPRILDQVIDVDVEMRQQVGLGHDHQCGGCKHAGIFQWFVLALGHRHDHHLVGLAEVEAGRTDEVAYILDE